MKRDSSRLDAKFDLLIIGGGISGATLAWDASLRGLKVALVDKGDFGCATSSATSKMIHGGLRYLKNGEVGLVRESLRERRYLQTIATHLVRPLPFLIPTYKRGGNVRWMIKGGMLAYDLLSWDRGRLSDPEQRIPRHRMYPAKKVLELEPGVSPQGLNGGAVYYDCLCDPDRLTLEFLTGAWELGAVLVNYAKVSAIACTEGRVGDVAVDDLLTGKQYQVEARMLVNVAGPWADHVDLLCGAGEEVELQRSKGIHIVTRSIVKNYTVVLRTSTGHHFFIVPWRGHSLIGTTDTKYAGSPDQLSVEDQDVTDFIADINQAYPGASLTPDDVTYRYAGVRPLVDRESQVYRASRKYEIVDHHKQGLKGYMAAIGGKYTTSRNLARKLTDRILARLNRPRIACTTHKNLLPGSVTGSFAAYLNQSLENDQSGLPKDVLEHLIWTYGARHDRILKYVEKDKTLAERIEEGRPEILAQVAFAIEKEMANTLCDIITRRTGIGTMGHPGEEALSKVLDLTSRLLGWDERRREREKETYRAKTRGLPEPQPLAGLH